MIFDLKTASLISLFGGSRAQSNNVVLKAIEYANRDDHSNAGYWFELKLVTGEIVFGTHDPVGPNDKCIVMHPSSPDVDLVINIDHVVSAEVKWD